MMNRILSYLTRLTLLITLTFALPVVIADPSPSSNMIDTTHQPTLGKANAPVQIVVFEDLKCPNCRDFNLTVLPSIKKKYIDTGIARYSLVILAFIPGSVPAGNAALCLYAQNRHYFFPFVDYVFQNQPSENTNWTTIPNLLSFAKNAVPNANMQKLTDCILESHYTPSLISNLKLAMKVMHNQVGTPAVYVNGAPVPTLTEAQLSTMIDNAETAQ